MSQNSLSVRGFTLVELIVAISVGMFIITGIMRALISLSDNTQVVDDGFTTMENREMFKRDMIAVKKEYPTIIINTGAVFLNTKYGFDITVLEHASGSGGIVIGTVTGDVNGLNYATGIVVGIPSKYQVYRPFYLIIDNLTKNNIKSSGKVDLSTLNLGSAFVYTRMYCTKFFFTTINRGVMWKFDMLTTGIFYGNKAGQPLGKVIYDSDFMEYNTSFLVR